MLLLHPISDFLYELFPDAKGKGTAALIDAIRTFYSLGEFVPEVSESNGLIEVRLDAATPITDARQLQRAIALCEAGDYSQAKPLLTDLAARNPTHSEVHRILGQIASDEGEQDTAINHLIDALRWDPKNIHALTMMGNIWAKFHGDIDTAMKYYDQARLVDPDDHLALNNIGAQLIKLGRLEEAQAVLEQARTLNPTYPNTHYGLALVHEQRGDPAAAFTAAIEALKNIGAKHTLWELSLELARKTATEAMAVVDGSGVVSAFSQELAERGGKPVKVQSDETIPTNAKLEVAETYKRDHHLVRYKPDHPGRVHLEMHELEHLRLILDARAEKANKLFVMRSDQRADLIRSMGKHVNRLSKQGYSEVSIAAYVKALVDGINGQVYNVPIDLFIEHRLYADHPSLRPVQFLSLSQLLAEAIHAVTAPNIVALTPPAIHSKSRTYNLLLAMQVAELFGLDRSKELGAAPSELALAKKFWGEFLEYRVDRQPGEEYELVQNWGADLGLDPYFELLDENTYQANGGAALDTQVESIEADPFDQQSDDPVRAEEQRTFHAAAAKLGLNMAVVMYMVDALQHFAGLTPQKVKEIALEIAMLGTQGIRPDHQGYQLHHVPGKLFSGFHLLAFYYVSWKQAMPEMLEGLRLPYDKEYGMAVQLNTAAT